MSYGRNVKSLMFLPIKISVNLYQKLKYFDLCLSNVDLCLKCMWYIHYILTFTKALSTALLASDS